MGRFDVLPFFGRHVELYTSYELGHFSPQIIRWILLAHFHLHHSPKIVIGQNKNAPRLHEVLEESAVVGMHEGGLE